MPIIAPHHRRASPLSTRNDYTPVCAWPDDCTVQWGGRGIVISEDSVRGTAFFEAFPVAKGFFRGEGKSVEDAEAACFKKWAAFSICDHKWGRGFIVESRGVEFKHGRMRPKLRGKTHYTNGGAICKKCKAFASMFKPVHALCSYKAGPSIHDLTLAAEGALRPASPAYQSKDLNKWARKSELLLRLAGVDLPETPDTPSQLDIFDDPNLDPYNVECRRAVVSWYVENREALAKTPGKMMQGFFDTLEQRSMERLVEEEQGYRTEQVETPQGDPI